MKRIDLLPSGFRGMDILLRDGMATLATLRGGPIPRIYLTNGQFLDLQRPDTYAVTLVDGMGQIVGEYRVGEGLRYQGLSFEIAPDPHCPSWGRLRSGADELAILYPDHIDLIEKFADPALLLFASWIFREWSAQEGAGWVS